MNGPELDFLVKRTSDESVSVSPVPVDSVNLGVVRFDHHDGNRAFLRQVSESRKRSRQMGIPCYPRRTPPCHEPWPGYGHVDDST